MEEVTHDWLTNTEAGPQRVTAFVPFKQGSPTTTTTTEANLPSQQESSNSPFISTADISPVLSKKMAGVHTARPQPVYPQNLQQSPLGPKQSDTKSNLQQVAAVSDCWCGKGGVNGALLGHNLVDVTSVSAQQILDEFMQQLQAHNNVGGGTELQVREEWVEGVKPTAEEADWKGSMLEVDLCLKYHRNTLDKMVLLLTYCIYCSFRLQTLCLNLPITLKPKAWPKQVNDVNTLPPKTTMETHKMQQILVIYNLYTYYLTYLLIFSLRSNSCVTNIILNPLIL